MLSIGSHATMGALIAKGNDTNPVLGAIQAVMVESVAHSPFANSLAGGAAMAATYAWMIADLAQLDQVIKDMMTSPEPSPEYEELEAPPDYTAHFYAGGRTG